MFGAIAAGKVVVFAKPSPVFFTSQQIELWQPTDIPANLAGAKKQDREISVLFMYEVFKLRTT